MYAIQISKIPKNQNLFSLQASKKPLYFMSPKLYDISDSFMDIRANHPQRSTIHSKLINCLNLAK